MYASLYLCIITTIIILIIIIIIIRSHFGTNEAKASSKMASPSSLNEVINKLKATVNIDARGETILAAAITLRDSTWRNRRAALRQMASAWKVTLNQKVDGKYKPRPNAALAGDIEAALCKAALDWESQSDSSQSCDTRYPSTVDVESVQKKAKRLDENRTDQDMPSPTKMPRMRGSKP